MTKPELPNSAQRLLKVLIVDDSADATEMLALLLERKSCETVSAHTGADALAAFDQHQPDLVLLDLGLPDMDGRAVAAKLREKPTRAVIVAVSGFAEDSTRASSNDFAKHLLKPIEIAALDQVLAMVRAGC
ncbi:MAG TPA: response regulator [Polyangiales bacterium]|jgi:CheY-like chemotaxis protein|nr:response regulator [Polyangiales bacterium]